MTTRTEPEVIELSTEKLQGTMQYLVTLAQDEHYPSLRAIVESHVFLTCELSKKRVNVQQWQQRLFGARAETTAAVLSRETAAPLASPKEAAGGHQDRTDVVSPINWMRTAVVR